MTDQNLIPANRRSHRGVFFTGAGILCAVAVTLAGCSGLSKNKDSLAATSQTGQVETKQAGTGRARIAKSERARKAAVKKLAVALTTNKTLKKQLLGAKNSAEKFREEAQAADEDIADLEAELVKAKTEPAKTVEASSTPQQSEQMAESLKAELDKANNERDVLKAQLDEKQNDSAQVIEKMLAAASREAKESRAESEKLTKQVQAAQAKVVSASDSNRIVHVLYRQSVKERAQVEQATAKQAEALRNQLTTAKRKTSEAQAEAKTARTELATANAEIARLKAVPAEKPTSSAAQQPAQPQ